MATSISGKPSLKLASSNFIQLDDHHFRLKETISASTALMNLFEEGQHIIDCVTALELCQYYPKKISSNLR